MTDGVDPFDLARFVGAQAEAYAPALAELRAGRKQTHWIWYVLPQLKALGRSHLANFYGIASLDEARAYLAHPILGARLRECVQAIGTHAGKLSAEQILGPVDALKYRSCLTLFKAAEGSAGSGFAQALDDFYKGREDELTLALL